LVLNMNCRYEMKTMLVGFDYTAAHAGAELRFDMQVELRITGKRLGTKHHR